MSGELEELKEEEREVLSSIYEGDTNFKQVSDSVFQYKLGDDGHHQSLLLEISWGENYPDSIPQISLDAFYNKNILPEIKRSIIDKLEEQAEMLVGTAMTYSLFEWLRENLAELTQNQPETVIEQTGDNISSSSQPAQPVEKMKKEKKEQLTKAQKRRIINRIDMKTGDRPRGWDWVDVVKHLSQTGCKE